MGHPARFRGPARGAPPAAPLAGQARRSAPSRRASIRPLAALPWPPRDGRPARSVLPRQRPLPPPSADTGAKVNSPPSLAPGRRRRLPGRFPFSYSPAPLSTAVRARAAAQRPLPRAGRSARPPGPAPVRPRGWRKGLHGALGRDPLPLGPAAAPPAFSLVERLEGGSEPLRRRARETAEDTASPSRPGCCSVTEGQTARFLFVWGDCALTFCFFLFSFFPSNVASVTPCLQNTGFPFHDQKLRVCVCWRDKINTR